MTFWRLWWLSLAVKFLLAALIPLSPDEAYYWVWSNKLALSYYDHPAMVAIIYWLGHPLENLMSLVRWPGVLIGHLTILVWRDLFKSAFSAHQETIFLALYLATPLLGLGSLVITPDIPLLLFWSLSLLFLFELHRAPEFHMGKVALLGLGLGLGFASKYVMGIYGFGFFLFLFLTRDFRLLKPMALATLTFGFLLGSAPVWIWNLQNGFQSLLFQLNHGFTPDKRWSLTTPLEYLALQFFAFIPSTWLLLKSKAPRDLKTLTFAFSGSVFGFFLISSFKSTVEPNWPLVAFPPLIGLATVSISKSRAKLQKIHLLVGSVLALLVLSELLFSWAPRSFYKKTDEVYMYDELSRSLEEFKGKKIFARNYQMASMLAWRLKKNITKLKGLNRRDHYDTLPESSDTTGEFLLILLKNQAIPEELVQKHHKILFEVGDFRVHQFVGDMN